MLIMGSEMFDYWACEPALIPPPPPRPGENLI